MKILMVLTSYDHLGETGRKTGFWLEELAAHHYVQGRRRRDDTRSAKGGQPARPKERRSGFTNRSDLAFRVPDSIASAEVTR